MFYPVDSLRKGGRFYLCWVADSWPMRFASITKRQLWSQDIRKLSDELMEVMQNESGRPSKRFSLRLSSQLMRGLVRLYEKKVNSYLLELCTMSALIFKHTNKKFNLDLEVAHRERPQRLVLQQPQETIPEEQEFEPRVEQLIQNSGNAVANIQDITLKEAAIPEFQLPPNDGFGEENPNEAVPLLGDRTMEMMMAPTDTSALHSGLDLPGLDLTDKSHDKSRLVPLDRQMERISEHDLSLFRKSRGEDLTVEELGKEIPGIPEVLIPEIPDVMIPEIPVPQEKEQEVPMEIPEIVEPPPKEAPVPESPTKKRPRTRSQRASEQIELEELEEPQAKRRRLPRRLIIDKNIVLNSNFLRARIANTNVELRCEDSTDDIIDIQVPYSVYMGRPCKAGYKMHSNFSQTLTRMFMRNLGVVNKTTRVERDIEEGLVTEGMVRRITRSRSTILEHVDEIEDLARKQLVQKDTSPQLPEHLRGPEITEQDISELLHKAHDSTYTTILQHRDQDISALKEIDINLMQFKQTDIDITEQQRGPEALTQKIITPSQQARKLLGFEDENTSPKRLHGVGYISFRESQRQQLEMEIAAPVILEPQVEPQFPFPVDTDVDKENVPANIQMTVPRPRRSQGSDKTVAALLQEAGLADIQPEQTLQPEQRAPSQGKVSRRVGSEGSETPLGSLDRTRVSLGDSEKTSDSKRFIRDHWGAEATMMKIMQCLKRGKVITVNTLLTVGPLIPGQKAMIAARCFSSILKLKQHGLISVEKCPKTLEILKIELGPKLLSISNK